MSIVPTYGLYMLMSRSVFNWMCLQGKGKSPPGVYPGDRLFKVNGDSTELMSLEAAWSSVARAARPVMLHFLGPVSTAACAIYRSAVDGLNERGGRKKANKID